MVLKDRKAFKVRLVPKVRLVSAARKERPAPMARKEFPEHKVFKVQPAGKDRKAPMERKVFKVCKVAPESKVRSALELRSGVRLRTMQLSSR